MIIRALLVRPGPSQERTTIPQPTDPAKLAKALRDLAAPADPPVRLQLGLDAVKRIEQKYAFVQTESQCWLLLSTSTDLN
jgi:hypothetical protein